MALGAVVSLQAETPEKKKTGWFKKISGLDTSESDKPTSVAGVRGLDETSDEIDTSARDFEALAHIEKLPAPDRDVETFVKMGKLR